MDRTERLLDLVATLLDASEPVPFARIRELFPDYAEGSAEANERKFERDKAELAELGIPLRYEGGDEDNQAGYLIDRDAYFLPELKLRADEWAVLYASGSAALASGAFPGARDLGHALRKIAFSRGAEPVPQFTDALYFSPDPGQRDKALKEKLEALWQAVQLKKRVKFSYRNFAQEQTQRDFDPYGIAFRRGVWITVGFCHFRKAMRTFNVNRIVSDVEVNQKKPKSPDFDVPADFSLEKHASEQSWEHQVHEPVQVVLAVDPSLAPIAGRLFPHARVEGEGTKVVVAARNTDALVRQVLALGTRVQVVGPAEVRAKAKALLADLRRDLQSVEAKR